MSNLKVKLVESPEELADAQLVRKKVFQEEQGIEQNLDFDGRDEVADHVVIYDGVNPVGTARVRYLDENKEIAKIERVAVLSEYRGSGIGKIIMDFVHEHLKSIESKEAMLESQEHAKGFYEKLGYEQKGESFEEVGVPHVEMRRLIK